MAPPKSQNNRQEEDIDDRALKAIEETLAMLDSPPPIPLPQPSPSPPVPEDDYRFAKVVYQSIAQQTDETRKLKAALKEKDSKLTEYERQLQENREELQKLKMQLKNEAVKSAHAQILLKNSYHSIIDLRLTFNQFLKQDRTLTSSLVVEDLEHRMETLASDLDANEATTPGDHSRVQEELQVMNRILLELTSTPSTSSSFPTIINVCGTGIPASPEVEVLDVSDSEPVIVDVIERVSSQVLPLFQPSQEESNQVPSSPWRIAHKVDISRVPQGSYCVCGVKFNSKNHKYNHLKYYSQQKRFKCHVEGCGKRFVGASVLKQHLKVNHKFEVRGEAYGCRFCGAYLSSWKALSNHRRQLHSSILEDDVSLEAYPTAGSSEVEQDIKVLAFAPENRPSSSQDPVDVELPAPSGSTFRHRVDPTKRHLGAYCTCGHRSTTMNALHAHMWYRNHLGKFKCTICQPERSYPGRSYLNKHMYKVHKMVPVRAVPQQDEGQNPPLTPVPSLNARPRREQTILHHGVDSSRANEGFFCLCGLECTSAFELTIHIRELTVTGVKYDCMRSTCRQRFTTVKSVRRHMIRRHGVPPKTIFRGCADCGGVFQSDEDRKEHRRVVHNIVTRHRSKPRAPPVSKVNHGFSDLASSTSGQPFLCKCGKGFPKERALIHHIQMQFQGNVFECGFCSTDVRFGSHEDLRYHILRHHKNVRYRKNYGCTQCGRAFKTEEHYFDHCRMDHR